MRSRILRLTLTPGRAWTDHARRKYLGRTSSAEMLGQFRTYAGHQLRFGKTTVNDLQFIGARMRTSFYHVCGISTLTFPRQAKRKNYTCILLRPFLI